MRARSRRRGGGGRARVRRRFLLRHSCVRERTNEAPLDSAGRWARLAVCGPVVRAPTTIPTSRVDMPAVERVAAVAAVAAVAGRRRAFERRPTTSHESSLGFPRKDNIRGVRRCTLERAALRGVRAHPARTKLYCTHHRPTTPFRVTDSRSLSSLRLALWIDEHPESSLLPVRASPLRLAHLRALRRHAPQRRRDWGGIAEVVVGKRGGDCARRLLRAIVRDARTQVVRGVGGPDAMVQKSRTGP